MHKILLQTTGIVLLMITGAFAQPGTFQLEFGGPGFDEANAIAQTSDHGYIVTGTMYSPTGGFDVLLLKLAEDGTVQWSKTYGGALQDIGIDVIQTTDSGYLVVGYTESFGAGQFDIYLIRTNSTGDTLWTRTYGDTGDDYGNRVVINSNGEYTITGMVQFSTAKAAVLIVDDAGTLKHQGYVEASGGASTDYKGTFLDNGRIGISHMFNTVFAITDSLGVYQQAYNYSYNGPSIDAVFTSNQEIAILVYTDIGGVAGEKFAIHKSDLAGIKIWGWKYSLASNNNIPVSILEAPDYGFTILGTSSTISAGLGSISLLHVDTGGAILWAKNYSLNSNSDHIAKRVIRTADHGYAIASYVSAPGSFTDYDLLIIKTDSAGNSGCNEQNITMTRGIFSDFPPVPVSAYTASMTNSGTASNASATNPGLAATFLCTTMSINEKYQKLRVEVFPNPVSDRLFIRLLDDMTKSFRIELYDLSGQLLKCETAYNGKAVDCGNIAPGIYTLSINIDSERIQQQLLVKTAW